MIRLERLSIQQYPGLAGPVDLEFGSGINVLLGRNGSGKTTLLRLIAMILKGTFAELEGKEARFSYELAAGGCSVGMTLRLGLEPGGELPVPRTATWEWTLTAWLPSGKQLSGSGTPSSRELGGRPAPSPFGDSWAARALLSAAAPEMAMPEPWGPHAEFLEECFWGLLGSDTMRGRFDEALDVFRLIVDGVSVPGAGLPRVPEVTVGGPAGSERRVPPELTGAVQQLRDAERSPSVTVPQASLQFLSRFIELAELRDGSLVCHLRDASGLRGVEVSTYGEFHLFVQIDEETTLPHGSLSFGQKRLFAFLFYAASNPDGVIIADELVNGFHHSWVKAAIEEIGTRQAFLASQNPLLLDFLTFESEEDVRRAFVLCTSELQGGVRRWAWRKPDAGETALFFRSFRAGVRHVSDILRTQGLW